jgi:hypothetical protein
MNGDYPSMDSFGTPAQREIIPEVPASRHSKSDRAAPSIARDDGWPREAVEPPKKTRVWVSHNQKIQEQNMGDMPDLDRVKNSARDVHSDVNALAFETVEALRKAVEELTAIVGANAIATRDIGQAKLEDLSAAIRRNPLTYLAAGVGAGLVVGLWRQRDIRR